MTRYCSKSITPDGLTGMIFAMEGIKNSVVLLNGPMGCKFYHSTTSRFLMERPPLYLPAREDGERVPVDYNFLNNWFFRQSRVPCTYLDGYDYVYGTAEKVEAGLKYLKEHVDFELLVIVNSPGASLIGDHLEEIAKRVFLHLPVVVLESPGFSDDYCTGYETAAEKLLEMVTDKCWRKGRSIKERTANENTDKKDPAKKICADVPGSKEKLSVNLLGLTIWHRNYEGDIRELKRLFGLCGVRVNTCLCAGSSLDEILRLPEADENVVVYPELGLKTAEYLKKTTGVPFCMFQGPPVGFSATEEFFKDFCGRHGLDSSPVLRKAEGARALAWSKINGIYQMCGLPDGTSFAMEGTSSEVYAYSRFLMDYFGMIPDSLSVTGGRMPVFDRMLEDYLKEKHAGHPQNRELMDTKAELVFGNGNTIAALKVRRDHFCGIEIANPGMGYVDVIPKTTLGIQGSLHLTELVLNGLMSRL